MLWIYGSLVLKHWRYCSFALSHLYATSCYFESCYQGLPFLKIITCPTSKNFEILRCLYEIKRKNLFKSTCPTGSFTCPRLSGSGKRRALVMMGPGLVSLTEITRYALLSQGQHWNRNFVIFDEIFITGCIKSLTTFGAASAENFIKMMTFPLQGRQ